MKKLMSMLFVLLISATLLVGCGGGYQDGTYKASFKDFDDNDWKAFIEITIEDGEITDAVFDYVNEAGELKSEDEEYNQIMQDASGTSPKEFAPALAKDLVEKQSVKKVDDITGATASSENFRVLAQAALKNASSGNTEEAIVE